MYFRSKYYPLFFLALACIFSIEAVAQSNAVSNYIFVDQVVDLEFEPGDAYLVLDFGSGAPLRIKAAMSKVLKESGEDSKRWIVAAAIPAEEDRSLLNLSVIVVSSHGEYAFVPPLKIDLRKRQQHYYSIDALRSYLLAEKEIERSWKMQLRTQAESLERLKSDAMVIADMDRLQDIKEEITYTKLRTKELESDIANLKRSLELARKVKEPASFRKREGELTRAVSELAQLAIQAETTELERKAVSESELKDKIALIEETRDDSLEDLEGTVANLRRNM